MDCRLFVGEDEHFINREGISAESDEAALLLTLASIVYLDAQRMSLSSVIGRSRMRLPVAW